MSSFAATISLKKSLIKDKFGRSVKPSQTDSSPDVVESLLKKKSDLENKLEVLELKLDSTRQDLDTANSTIRQLTSKYQDDLRLDRQDKNVDQHLPVTELNQEDSLSFMGTTEKLEKLRADDMKGNLDKGFVNEVYRYKCEEDEGSFVLSIPKLPPDTLKHSYAITMKVDAPCVPSVVAHWFPLPRDNNFDTGNALTTPSMRSHYVRLPNPGETFTALEHYDQEFQELLRARRRGENCRHS